MAEQFLVLMAELDGESQASMSAWYDELREAGFMGTQTPGLPYHISLASFPTEKEREAALLTEKVAARFPVFPVHISHIGIFAPGKVLFGGPEKDAMLTALHDACASEEPQKGPWTPHVTLLIDEPETVCRALPVLVKSFSPFIAKIVRLRLCVFWPTREIAVRELTGSRTE